MVLTPEEWVRQHFVQYLVNQVSCPASLIAIEMPVDVNTRKQRSDIVVYDRNAKPLLMVECKRPTVSIDQSTFDQIARYNMTLNVKYLVVTNGLNHYYCTMDHEAKAYEFLRELPAYDEM